MKHVNRNWIGEFRKVESLSFCKLFFFLLPVLLAGCGTVSHLVDNSYMQEYVVKDISAADPSLPGSYKYRTYFYGKGDDHHRKEYGASVDFKTKPVDARPFVKGIGGKKRRERKQYWGFGFDELPLNGRIWFPEGAGPFPLVMIVHGNHNMKEYSDPGYAYLAELFASRGFIAVSVDENFLNGGIRTENDARAFMLLEHLKVWQTWNENEGHEFNGKVDMDRIALIGHSRGGESVAHAAAFNRLSRYPDDANIKFDYNFAIRSIVAIAPADGQYKPAGHLTPLENINYLVFHGGHDADASIFMGIRQFNRVNFTDDNFWFKSAIYIYRANHNQFNTVWGKFDVPGTNRALLNQKPIMALEKQRQIAKTILPAFLEATINDRDEYLPVFQNIRKASAWLPQDIYVNQYQDSNFKVIANFEEDIDVTTTTIPGGKLLGENIGTWKEAHVPFKFKIKPLIIKTTLDNATVVLGWNNQGSKNNGSKKTGSYAIKLNPKTTTDLSLTQNTKLVFSIGATEEMPPKPPNVKNKSKQNKDDKIDKENRSGPLDLTIALEDSDGESARVPLSTVGPIHPALSVRIAKWEWLEKKFFKMFSERIFQTYQIPISHFTENNAAFNPTKLETIRFVFDRSPKGTIMLDEIGISQ
jgi:predicted dienelactone hydrolase